MLSLNNLQLALPPIGPLSLKIDGHTAVVGPSGAGKTTLFRSLLGLTRCRGDIALDGRPLTTGGKALSHGPSRGISMAWQDDRLLPHLTLLANASLGSSISAAEKWFKILGIETFKGRYPHQVSGGEAQRANLARALAGTSKVVLLDEPFHGVDAATVRGVLLPVLDCLAEEGRLALMISHDIGTIIGVFSQVMVLKDGKAVFHGAATELYETPGDAWLAGFLGDYHIIERSDHLTGKMARGCSKCFVRPEWFGVDHAATTKNATVVSSLWKGVTQRVWVLLDGREQPIHLEVLVHTSFTKGERIHVTLNKTTCPDWLGS